MNPTDEFVKMINEEAAAWKPSDDEHADELAELLMESMLSSGAIRPETYAALNEAVSGVSVEEVGPDASRILGRGFGMMLRVRREAEGRTLDVLAAEVRMDGLIAGRVEAGRANPSVLSPRVLADWLACLSFSAADMKAALLLALQHVNRTTVELGASFARSKDVGGRGRALSRTEANEYFDRVSAMRERRGI